MKKTNLWYLIGAVGIVGSFATRSGARLFAEKFNGAAVVLEKSSGYLSIECENEYQFSIRKMTAAEAATYKAAKFVVGSAEGLQQEAAAIVHGGNYEIVETIVSAEERAEELEAEAQKRAAAVVDGCDCSICQNNAERAEAARAALNELLNGGAVVLEAKQEETEARAAVVESAAEDERAARLMLDKGFYINTSAIIDSHNVSSSEDLEQVRRQLWDAPLFSNIRAVDIYAKRAPIMYNLTDGTEVLEVAAVEVSDYMERFTRQVRICMNELYYKMTYSEYNELSRFWYNASILRRGVIENKIDAEVMDSFSIRSPKFSKFLIKTFGEKSAAVRMFNDRPKAADIEKQTAVVIEDKKLFVSNLASNVMKMTAGNEFDSCQNYTYEDSGDLDYLQKLPSSVHDETLSIIYLTDDIETYEHPTMLARVLVSPLVYNDQLFFIGWNLYGDGGNDDLLKSSVKNLYGARFLFADELYNTENMAEYKHNYDYQLRVDFDYNNECYLCEGSGEVRAVVRWHDYEFTTTCPHCDGDGKTEDGSYGATPYVNNSSIVRFGHNYKITRADEKTLLSILDDELYGGKTLFDAAEA